MIERKYQGKDLIGKKCRPVRTIRNGTGSCVTPDTVCTIVRVVRGHGFIIETARCPHCGQCAYITGVSRNEIELIEGRESDEL